MSEHLVPVRKETGGFSITGPDGNAYTWGKDGSVTEVPYDFALELCRIAGAGFSTVEPGGEVTEPAPKDEHEVTEPAPKAAVEEKPKPRAGARTQHKAGGQ